MTVVTDKMLLVYVTILCAPSFLLALLLESVAPLKSQVSRRPWHNTQPAYMPQDHDLLRNVIFHRHPSAVVTKGCFVCTLPCQC